MNTCKRIINFHWNQCGLTEVELSIRKYISTACLNGPKNLACLMSWKLKHKNSSFLGYAAKEKCPQQWGHERDAEAGKTEPRRKTNAGMYERLTTGVVLGDRNL